MRIVIITDSMGLARPWLAKEDERTEYEDTYPYLLRKKYQGKNEVEILTHWGLDTADFRHYIYYLATIKRADIVIIHVGINDCSPRVFSKGSRSILVRPWFAKWTRNISVRLIHKYRHIFTRVIRKVYVKKEIFKENLIYIKNDIKKFNSAAEMIAISICLSSDELLRRSYGLKKNILTYNEIMKEIFQENYIEINDILNNNSIHISDGIHLKPEVHLMLSDLIDRKIKQVRK